MTTPVDPEYLLGFSEKEHHRLMVQATLYDALTERAFRAAGVAPGMRVLDCGPGAGDTTLLAARIVGPTGHVLGVDQSPESVARATERARTLGVTNVTFEVGSLTAFARPQRFDAIIGRFIVLYLPDRTRTFTQIVQHLVPGGVAAFCEFDMHVYRCLPHAPQLDATMDRIRRTADAAGFDTQMGIHLPALLREAGLVDIAAEGASRILDGDVSIVADWIATTVENLAPLGSKIGAVPLAEWRVETLRDRLIAEFVELKPTIGLPMLVGAYGRRPLVG